MHTTIVALSTLIRTLCGRCSCRMSFYVCQLISIETAFRNGGSSLGHHRTAAVSFACVKLEPASRENGNLVG